MTALRHLRLVALLEGSSFLVLLFIAMPLKYLADQPLAVRIVGSIHGLLFVIFMAALFRAGSVHRGKVKAPAAMPNRGTGSYPRRGLIV